MNVYYCVLFSSRVRVRIRVRIRFCVWLVSCYAHVFVLVSIVIVTLPHRRGCYGACCSVIMAILDLIDQNQCAVEWRCVLTKWLVLMHLSKPQCRSYPLFLKHSAYARFQIKNCFKYFAAVNLLGWTQWHKTILANKLNQRKNIYAYVKYRMHVIRYFQARCDFTVRHSKLLDPTFNMKSHYSLGIPYTGYFRNWFCTDYWM